MMDGCNSGRNSENSGKAITTQGRELIQITENNKCMLTLETPDMSLGKNKNEKANEATRASLNGKNKTQLEIPQWAPASISTINPDCISYDYKKNRG
jgi:hypothetical protein